MTSFHVIPDSCLHLHSTQTVQTGNRQATRAIVEYLLWIWFFLLFFNLSLRWTGGYVLSWSNVEAPNTRWSNSNLRLEKWNWRLFNEKKDKFKFTTKWPIYIWFQTAKLIEWIETFPFIVRVTYLALPTNNIKLQRYDQATKKSTAIAKNIKKHWIDLNCRLIIRVVYSEIRSFLSTVSHKYVSNTRYEAILMKCPFKYTLNTEWHNVKCEQTALHSRCRANDQAITLFFFFYIIIIIVSIVRDVLRWQC